MHPLYENFLYIKSELFKQAYINLSHSCYILITNETSYNIQIYGMFKIHTNRYTINNENL